MINLTVKNDLQKHGIMLVSSSNDEFETELANNLKDYQAGVTPYLDAVKPFAVFVKNSSSKDVVGVSLRWDIIKLDGSVKVIPQTESAPNRLLGGKPRNSLTRGGLIASNSSRFFTLNWEIQGLVRDESQNKFVNRPTALDNKNLQSLKKYLPKLRDEQQKLIDQAEKISVSIDGVFFDDGTFIGTDQNYLFASMTASIQAKKDFANEVRKAISVKKNTKDIFDWFESLVKERPLAPEKFNSEAEKYEYSYKIEMYYAAKQALLKKQKLSNAEIIEIVTALDDGDSIQLKKENS